jgi:AcrR family transcriptional regulator
MEKKISTKQRILDTASNLFYYQGFNNTGINQIIAEADIAIGSLYKHYRSKNELLYSYLQTEDEQFFTGLNQYLRDEKDPKEKLLKLIDFRIHLQEKAHCSGCHFVKINAELGRKDEYVTELVLNHKAKQKAHLHEILDEISTAGSQSLETSLLANSLFLMIEGAVVSATINGNTNDLTSVKAYIQQLFQSI